MRRQNGNFLLQALLALTLVFAFMPFFASKLASRDTETRLYSVVNQIETVQNAARLFLRDEFRNYYPNGTVTFGDNPTGCPDNKDCHFRAALEPFGLPSGFNTKTVFDQNISLVASRVVDEDNNVKVSGYIRLNRGDLANKNLEWSQLLRMLGFYANSHNGSEIRIVVPVEEPYSDIVFRRETDENIGFVNELDMGGNDIDAIGVLYAVNGIVKKDAEDGGERDRGIAAVSNLSLVEDVELTVENLITDSSEFFVRSRSLMSEADRTALSLSGTNLNIVNDRHNAIMFVNNANCPLAELFVNGEAKISDLHMGTGALNFMDDGEAVWTFYDDVYFSNLAKFEVAKDLDVGRIIGAYLQHPNDNNPNPHYTFKDTEDVGVDVSNILFAGRIVVSGNSTIEQVVSKDTQGQYVIDIDLLGVSKLPDILFLANKDAPGKSLDNSKIKILENPLEKDAYTQSCAQFFNEKSEGFFSEDFSSTSLTYNIVCQYMYYQRLERRLNKKLFNMCIYGGKCH